MKRCLRRSIHLLISLAVGSLLLPLSGMATPETIDVFLLGGQSNADGRAAASGLPAALQLPQSNVLFYYGLGLKNLQPEAFTVINQGATQDFGPEVTFGLSMANYYASQPNNEVAIIKYGAGGSNLYSQWAAGGTGTETGDGSQYVDFQNQITNGIAAIRAANPTANIDIDGMIWMQGESDAAIVNGVDESLLYQQNLTNFIDDVRLTYGANLPFVIGELSSQQTGTGPAAQRNNVKTAQVAVGGALADTETLNTDAFPLNSDDLHFDTVGQEDLGYGFASDIQNIIGAPEPGSTSLALAGLAVVLAFGWSRRRRFRS